MFITMKNGEEHKFEIPESTTVKDIKILLSGWSNITLEDILVSRLQNKKSYALKDEDKSMYECEIEDNSTLSIEKITLEEGQTYEEYYKKSSKATHDMELKSKKKLI